MIAQPLDQTGLTDNTDETKHVRCPVCGWPMSFTGDTYPAHKMMKFGSAGISHGHPCPRSGKPFDPLAPRLAVQLPWAHLK